jgi:hypothetical protein
MLNNIDLETRIDQSLTFIEGCELGDCNHASHPMPRLAGFEVDEMNPEALVAGDAIVSIVAGMTKENKQIVKDTILFATLVANKAHPNGGVAWYEQFTKVLANCGWLSLSTGMSDYRVGNSRFTMEQAALKILESAIVAAALPGPTSLLLLKVAKDTVTALQESEKPLRLFEQSSKTHNGAKFAIASAAESSDGEIVMAMGALDFSTRLDVTNVLFWEWNSSSVQIKRAENHMTLNQAHFVRVRDVIEGKLNDQARQALEEFDI